MNFQFDLLEFKNYERIIPSALLHGKTPWTYIYSACVKSTKL